MPAVVPLANPLQNPSTWVSPGVNLIGAARALDGFRTGTNIRIHAVSLDLRAQLEMIAATSPTFGFVEVKWKMFATMYDGSDVTDAKPELENLGNLISRFGYSTKLDLLEFEYQKDFKIKHLAHGSLRFRTSTTDTQTKFQSRYIKLKKSLRVEYEAAEQNGRRIMRWKPFIAIQSNIPIASAALYKPTLHACTKVYYTNS